MRKDPEALLTKVLRENNYSVTSARKAVFALLLRKEPQTMRQLIRAANGTVDRVSIYRAVELFEKLGIAQRITIGWKYKIELSEVFLEHHHHINCLGCGKIVAVKEQPEIEERIKQIARDSGFVLQSHQLELQGLCATCQQRVL
ncbi:MAG TPA: Fur family transcriptional regulator [Candidatus Saccharimonadales bacterium]